jgi:uncharacterized protein (DUF433 family)
MGSIHLIHIPDREARIRAIKAFLDVREAWMCFPDNLFGLCSEHLAALTRSQIPFEDACQRVAPSSETAMNVLEQQPLTLTVPLRQDPPGVLRVGKTRVLLEMVVRAYQRGASPQDIVRMYDALDLADVFAVIAFYLAYPVEIHEYLHRCDGEADAVRRKIEAAQPPQPSKDELLARARAKGLNV